MNEADVLRVLRLVLDLVSAIVASGRDPIEELSKLHMEFSSGARFRVDEEVRRAMNEKFGRENLPR